MRMPPAHGRRRADSNVSVTVGDAGRGRRRADSPSTIRLRRIGTFAGLTAAATGLAVTGALPLVQADSRDAATDRSDLQASAASSSAAAAVDEGTAEFDRSAVSGDTAVRHTQGGQPYSGPLALTGSATLGERTALAASAATGTSAPAVGAVSGAVAAAEEAAAPANGAVRHTASAATGAVAPVTAAAKEAAAPATAAAGEATEPAGAATSGPATSVERAVPGDVAPTERTVSSKAAAPAEPAPQSEAGAPGELPEPGITPVPSDPAVDAPEEQVVPEQDRPADGHKRHWMDHPWWGEWHQP